MTDDNISARITIAAPAGTIFDVLADPATRAGCGSPSTPKKWMGT